ncbi:MAG: LAGLIDADG family homing endonuclease [Candidatus Heimdallarchaeaceae archaeon]
MTSIQSQKLPVYVNVKQTDHNSFLKINFKQINQLVRHDKMWFFTKMSIDLDQGGKKDYTKGFFIGFFIAEGNYIYYKHEIKKKSVFSRNALKRWSKTKGYNSIDDYLEEREDIGIKGLQLTCGIKDIEKGYLKKIPFKINMNQYRNTVCVRIYDKGAIKLVKKYVTGSTSKDKHLKSSAFNSSKQFLKGFLEGFIAGDGYIEKTRISIGMTSNYLLRDQLMLISKLNGMQPRYSETFAYATKEKKKKYQVLILRILSYKNRIIRNNIIFQNLRRIEEHMKENIYELEIESQLSISGEWNKIVVMGNGLVVQSKD